MAVRNHLLAIGTFAALGPVAAVIASAALGVFVFACRAQSPFAGRTMESGPGKTSAS